MSELIRRDWGWLVAIAVLVANSSIACSEAGGTKPERATETNVAPAPCESDDDCPLRCIPFNGEGGSSEALGFCEQAPSGNGEPGPER